jgi:hypothetical protein
MKMNATSLPSKKMDLGQFAEWSVLILTVLALLAGWLLMSGVENRSVTFSAAGISAQPPLGWLTSTAKGDEILHVTNPGASGFGTTYTIRNIPVTSDATFGQVISTLTLEHGQALTAFRVLDQQEVTVFGRSAFELSYVYVESNPDLTHNDLPNVVRGLDYIFLSGDHAIVATYWADENSFQSDLGRFQLFLSTLKY